MADEKVEKILGFLVSLVIFIIVAIIFFIILLFIIKVSGDLVFGSGKTNTYEAVVAASILVAAMLISGGSFKLFGKEL